MYKRKKMSGKDALAVIDGMLEELGRMDPFSLMTFELSFLHKCAENPPKRWRGREQEVAYTDPPKEND